MNIFIPYFIFTYIITFTSALYSYMRTLVTVWYHSFSFSLKNFPQYFLQGQPGCLVFADGPACGLDHIFRLQAVLGLSWILLSVCPEPHMQPDIQLHSSQSFRSTRVALLMACPTLVELPSEARGRREDSLGLKHHRLFLPRLIIF